MGCSRQHAVVVQKSGNHPTPHPFDPLTHDGLASSGSYAVPYCCVGRRNYLESRSGNTRQSWTAILICITEQLKFEPATTAGLHYSGHPSMIHLYALRCLFRIRESVPEDQYGPSSGTVDRCGTLDLASHKYCKGASSLCGTQAQIPCAPLFESQRWPGQVFA
ncbi:hypothetical protein BS47DRAFT_204279 [Hydnum rufescens UP504]|uniref:Uncharacterized protein n=1 Tax=Hydnum rufescens UP504 TaxID=1448309 RepID=A0A9P6ANB2_9AGAM|nr:hypothetical protein BS47DRAFT_204279 [Hydnum rufescens UP504]